MEGRSALLAGLGLLTGLAACSALGAAAGEVAASFGKDLLLGPAKANYDDQTAGILEGLLDRMAGGVGSALGAGAVDDDSGPLGLEVGVYREIVVDGRSVPVPVADGDVLRDGYGRDELGDNLKLQFTAADACYVYVVSVDATGWAQPLFPGAMGGTNPVSGGQSIDLPEGEQWLYLDAYRGVETVYFLASRERRPDIEDMLVQLAGLERPEEMEPRAAVEEPATLSRGFAGTRPGQAPAQVTASDGSAHAVMAQSFLASVGQAELVVTRWFRHE